MFKNVLRATISFTMVLCILLNTAACSGGKAKTDAGKTSDEVSAGPQLPKYDLANKEITILAQDDSHKSVKTFEEHYGGKVNSIIVSDQEVMTRFTTMVMSNSAPDLFINYLMPSFVAKGYLQEVDPYIDFNTPLWKDIKETNDKWAWDGKHYLVLPGVIRDNVVWYNKEIFEESGLDSPEKLYKEKNWNWNTFRELAIKLTTDADNDGLPETWGTCIDGVDVFLYSCGKHMVSLNKDGSATNNIKSPEIARAVNFFVNLYDVDLCVYSGADNRDKFRQGKIAMIAGGLWYRSLFKDMLANNSIGFVPFPKDPDADQYYLSEGAAGAMIPKGAKNPQGAAAFLASARFDTIDPKKKSASYEQIKKDVNWNDDLEKVFQEGLMGEDKVGVPITYISFNLQEFYGEVFARPRNGEPWATIAEEIAPRIDDKIQMAYEK